MPLTYRFSQPGAMADFNTVDESGRVPVLRSTYRGVVPSPGLIVTLRDHDGNVCEGRIEGIAGDLLDVRPVWATWVDAHQYRSPEGAQTEGSFVTSRPPATSASQP